MRPNEIRSELLTILLGLAPYYKRAFFYTLVGTFFALSPTVLMMQIYDRVLNSRNTTTLAMLLLLAFFVYVFMELLELIRARIMQSAGVELDQQLRTRVFDAIFAATLRKIPGASTQALSELRALRTFMASPAMLAILDAPASTVFLIFIFLIDPQLGTFSCVGALLQALLGYISERRTKMPLMQAQQAMIESQAYAASMLRNAPVVEAMGMLGSIQSRWLKKQVKFIGLQATASDHAGSSAAASKFVQIAQGSLIMALGCLLTVTGHLPGGGTMMIVASILSGRALQPLVQLIGMWKMVITTRDSYSRLDSFLASQPARRESMPLPAPKGVLAVEGVAAGAPGSSSQIIRGVGFTLAAGQSLAVVGPSASGKTTLARLLVGLWPTNAGKVRLDGVDIYAWDKKELGPYVGYLPQGVELFEGTLAENIARFGEHDIVKVQEAARAVGIDTFIESLPQGYDTPIGVDGGMLSGGERQRVGLARAIYGDPRLVVLDEPNSSLDEAGDRALAQTIQTLTSKGVTVVVITHRKALIDAAQLLLVLVDGAMRNFGPTADVLQAISGAARPSPPPPPHNLAKPALA